MVNKHILIIDDDEILSDIMKDMLEAYGYEVTCVTNSISGYEILKNNVIHLIILDVNLAKECGFEICAELRTMSTVPIIFSSARTSEDDRIIGLDIGGDDYIPKPFSLKELLSRVNALIRRTYGFNEEGKKYVFNDIEIDEGNRKIYKKGGEVSLSLKEYDLLLYMAKNKNKPLQKEVILRDVWGIYSEVEISTVAVHIRWLREKLEDNPSNPQYLKTIWGIGYSLCDNEKVT